MRGVDPEMDWPLGDPLVASGLPVRLILDLFPDFVEIHKFLGARVKNFLFFLTRGVHFKTFTAVIIAVS
jgi:hypothetical protein